MLATSQDSISRHGGAAHAFSASHGYTGSAERTFDDTTGSFVHTAFELHCAMPNRSIVNLQRRIERIKRDLSALSPLPPGTPSQQYSVCGTAGYRCTAAPPIKHGPYYQLSYTWHGQSDIRFVRYSKPVQVRQALANYERLRTLFASGLIRA